MNEPTKNAHSAGSSTKPPTWIRHIIWLGPACAIALLVAAAYLRHARGEDWLSAFGLPLDRDFFRLIGDFLVPVMVTVFLMNPVKKLPPSQEKTTLTRILWSFFVFLFVWWSPLHITLFGPS